MFLFEAERKQRGIAQAEKCIANPDYCASVQSLGMSVGRRAKSAYLPGTGDTVIMKAVPPGRGSPLHSGVADPCDYPKCG